MNNPEANQVLEQVDGLKKYFPVGNSKFFGPKEWVHAVDGISFSIRQGETFSIVGESGCGKTTTARMILLLEKPTSGSILFEGRDISSFKGKELRRYRMAVQAVFQDPWSSLNPRLRAKAIIAEPLVVNQKISKPEIQERIERLMVDVRLDPSFAMQYPHEFSGGQRQRIALARAMAVNPRLVVLDEPVSSLDVSIGAQVMNLLKDLQESHGVSYLLIAHNLATVRFLSHRVAVMYLGEIVEEAASRELFTNPLHPYTQALISASLPVHSKGNREEIVLSGEVPSPTTPPPGCRFHTRCPFAFDRCSHIVPELRELAPGHKVACHLY